MWWILDSVTLHLSLHVPTANLAIPLILPEMTSPHHSVPVPLFQVRLLPTAPRPLPELEYAQTHIQFSPLISLMCRERDQGRRTERVQGRMKKKDVIFPKDFAN